MTKRPPVPKENRSPKGTGDARPKEAGRKAMQPGRGDPDQQGQQANTKQNTTHQGLQLGR